jgi:subtilisin-like proprotein convertase family protein
VITVDPTLGHMTPTSAPAPATRRLLGSVAIAAVLTGALVTATAPGASAATTTFNAPASLAINNHLFAPFIDDAVTIPAMGPALIYPVPLNVSGIPGTIADINVMMVSLGHTFPSDLDVMLVGPGGQHVVLMSDVGADIPVSNLNVVLDDEAGGLLPTSTALTTGVFKPTNVGPGDSFPAPAPSSSTAATALSAFDGTDPNGTWKLYVVDDNINDAGTLAQGWQLSIDTTATSAPYPAALPVSGAGGPITDVDLELHGLTHSYPADIDMMLVGPGGQRAMVMSDAGQDKLVTADLVLDDEAAAPLPEVHGMVSGSYQPTNYVGFSGDPLPAPAPGTTGVGSALSVFDGTDPNGTWQLFVADNELFDSGTVAGGWSLRISTADQPVPAVGGIPGADSDHTAPKVANVRPAAAATGVRRGADVRGTFSERVRPRTLNSLSVRLLRKGSSTAVPARLTYDAARHRVTLDPTRPLRPHTTYRMVIATSVRDLAGNRLDQDPTKAGLQRSRWSFRTR